MNMQVSAIKTTQAPVEEVPVHDAVELTNDGTIAHIRLDQQVYTLRITRARKLILTK